LGNATQISLEATEECIIFKSIKILVIFSFINLKVTFYQFEEQWCLKPFKTNWPRGSFSKLKGTRYFSKIGSNINILNSFQRNLVFSWKALHRIGYFWKRQEPRYFLFIKAKWICYFSSDEDVECHPTLTSAKHGSLNTFQLFLPLQVWTRIYNRLKNITYLPLKHKVFREISINLHLN